MSLPDSVVVHVIAFLSSYHLVSFFFTDRIYSTPEREVNMHKTNKNYFWYLDVGK